MGWQVVVDTRIVFSHNTLFLDGFNTWMYFLRILCLVGFTPECVPWKSSVWFHTKISCRHKIAPKVSPCLHSLILTSSRLWQPVKVLLWVIASFSSSSCEFRVLIRSHKQISLFLLQFLFCLEQTINLLKPWAEIKVNEWLSLKLGLILCPWLRSDLIYIDVWD